MITEFMQSIQIIIAEAFPPQQMQSCQSTYNVPSESSRIEVTAKGRNDISSNIGSSIVSAEFQDLLWNTQQP